MSKKVVITGATGIIGKVLTQLLNSRGNEVTIFTRNPDNAKNILPGCKNYVEWDAYSEGEWVNYLEGQDAIIHLAGASIFGQLWSEEYKQKIYKSRVEGTRNLVTAISKAKKIPKQFISASAIGYYGASKSSVFNEDSLPGEGFLPEVSKNWEKETLHAEEFGVITARVRVGIVLDKNGGALNLLLTPFQNYLSGVVGDGAQWVSWIHNRDAANVFIYILDNELSGAFNAVTEHPVQMKDFAAALKEKCGDSITISVPKFAFKAILGEASIPVTEGIHCLPKNLIDKGFKFEYPHLKPALDNLI